MAKESAVLMVRISTSLKEQFEQVCQESEISMSDKVREMIANLVRSHKRQSGKITKEET